MSTASDDRVAFSRVSSFPVQRRRPRQDVTSALLYVDFGADNGGVVLNLSEDGFSVQTALPLAAESLSNMQLKGGSDAGCVEVRGRIVWMGDTRKTAGIQFAGLSDAARKQIAAWIAAEASPSQENQPPTNDSQQVPSAVPSSGAAGGELEEAPSPESDMDQWTDPFARELSADRPYRRPGKLLQLVRAEAPVPESTSSGLPELPIDRLDGTFVTSERSKRALSDFEDMLRSQLRGSQEPDASPSDVGRRSGARSSLLYSNAVLSTIFLLAALTFAAGLIAGYVLLDRPSKAAAKPLPSDFSALRDAAATSPDNQTVALNTTTVTTLDPAAHTRQTMPTPPVSQPTAPLPSAASTNHFEFSAPIRRSRRSRPVRPRASADLPSFHPGDTISQASLDLLLPAQPYRDQHAQQAQEPVIASDALSPKSLVRVQPQAVPMPVRRATPAVAPPHQPAQSPSALLTPSASAVPSPKNVTRSSSDSSGSPGAHAQPEKPEILPPAGPGHMQPSRLIQSVQPIYPREARKRHVEGNVELRVLVGTDGTVRSVKVVSGPPLLGAAAMVAARGFRYSPAVLNGHPIETIETVDMSFKLKSTR